MWWFSRKREQGGMATVEELNQLVSMVSKGLAQVASEISRTRDSFNSHIGSLTKQVSENNDKIYTRSACADYESMKSEFAEVVTERVEHAFEATRLQTKDVVETSQDVVLDHIAVLEEAIVKCIKNDANKSKATKRRGVKK